MTVWKYANLALVAAVYICDPRQHKRIEQVSCLMLPITGHTRIIVIVWHIVTLVLVAPMSLIVIDTLYNIAFVLVHYVLIVPWLLH